FSPSEFFVPANRLEDKSGKCVQVLVVGDMKTTVLFVHAHQCRMPPGAVVSVLKNFGENEYRIIVAFLSALHKLSRLYEQWRAFGHSKYAKQGKFERAGSVPRKFITGEQVGDFLAIAQRIEGRDIIADGIAAARADGSGGFL